MLVRVMPKYLHDHKEKKYVDGFDMLGCAQDAMDAEREHLAYFEVESFPRSSCVTSMRTLPITVLVDDDHIPMKLEKLIGI